MGKGDYNKEGTNGCTSATEEVRRRSAEVYEVYEVYKVYEVCEVYEVYEAYEVYEVGTNVAKEFIFWEKSRKQGRIRREFESSVE